jgi:Uma2 family endonuclease
MALHMATVSTRQHHPTVPLASSHGQLCVRIPTRALTLQGFREWATSDDFPEHVRVAFIDNEVYVDMSNEEWEAHVGVKTEVYAVLAPLVRQEKLGKFYADGGLLTNEAAGVSNNPDACFCSRESLRSARVRVVARKGQPGRLQDLVGTPDWVLEVISDSSVGKDTEQLRKAYHKAGIPEYWLIDARGDEIQFTILIHRKAGYVAAGVKDGWQRSKAFGRDFRFTRQQDEFGLWEYTLAVRHP